MAGVMVLTRMRVVCSFCWTVVRDDGTAEGGVMADGMCGECEAYSRRLRDGIPLGGNLDALRDPALVITADGRVVGVNSAFTAFTGREASAVQGCLTGEAMGCTRSRLPGGCGRTTHCRDCTIRRMVAEVSRTRLARWRVPAYVDTRDERVELLITVRPAERDLVLVVLEDAPGALMRVRKLDVASASPPAKPASRP